MTRILKKYGKMYWNWDKKIVEILDVEDEKYRNGLMYTFRYLKYDEGAKKYSTLFAIENNHGIPHIHRNGKKEFVDFDWKTAWAEFDRMVAEYRKRNC